MGLSDLACRHRAAPVAPARPPGQGRLPDPRAAAAQGPGTVSRRQPAKVAARHRHHRSAPRTAKPVDTRRTAEPENTPRIADPVDTRRGPEPVDSPRGRG